MSYPPHYSGTYQQPSYPTTVPVGSDGILLSVMLGPLLGELKSGQAQTIATLQAQTNILQQIHQQLTANATTLAERLPTKAHRSIDDRLITIRDLIKTILPLAILSAIVMGKITWSDAWPMLRTLLGLGG